MKKSQLQPSESGMKSTDAPDLHERLHLLGLMDVNTRQSFIDSLGAFFTDLADQIDLTISGSKLLRINPINAQNGFHRLEINSESGKNLGWLHMLYLHKPIPAYYLVYVEISPFFRNKGLGNRILHHFKKFLIEKSAVGILDNIIPREDPAFHLYGHQDWRPVADVIGKPLQRDLEQYMVYIPAHLHALHLKSALQKLLYHLARKREVIDMRDNELMVKQTIQEFKELRQVLLDHDSSPIRQLLPDSSWRFFLTRFVNKLIAFRRMIGDLIGYTGGESLEQIGLPPEIASLPIQSYIPFDWPQDISFVCGNFSHLSSLPKALLKQPARFIESLPNYQRPHLLSWLSENGFDHSHGFTLGDVLELGFDPTRLKELEIDNEHFIFERVQRKTWAEIEKKQILLSRLGKVMEHQTANGSWMKLNPPLLWITDQGHTYILRRKLQGIHWQEASEQLQTREELKKINQLADIDQLIRHTVRTAMDLLSARVTAEEQKELQYLSWFVSWNLAINQPELIFQASGHFFDSIWIA